MKSRSRKIWEQPWGYAEGFIVAAGILLTGLMLQLTVGNIEPALFASPVNVIMGASLTAGLIAVYFPLPQNKAIKWLSGVYAAVPAIVVLLLLCMILGLTPQLPLSTGRMQASDNLFSRLGWAQMTTSWSFILLCFYILIILELTLLRRTRKKQSWRDIGFYLNHLGLFVALLAGLSGSADLKRFTMSVQEGQVEWRGTGQSGETIELPVAIQLDTFRIEEYPPRLVVVENMTGKILPAAHPESYHFVEIGKTARLADVSLEIMDYLPHAAILRDSTFVNVVPMMMEGAGTAIKVKAAKPGMEQPVEGWVSSGSYLFPHSTLPVDEFTSIVMPPQEVKKYKSFVTLYSEKGTNLQAVIEVNKPLTVEEWMIYQYSYDNSKGKHSDVSIFELVRDPWLKVVYTGIFMLLAGALFLFIAGPKKRTA